MTYLNKPKTFLFCSLSLILKFSISLFIASLLLTTFLKRIFLLQSLRGPFDKLLKTLIQINEEKFTKFEIVTFENPKIKIINGEKFLLAT